MNFFLAAKEEGSKKEETQEEKKDKEESGSKDDNKVNKAIEDKKMMFEFPSEYAHELCTLRQNIVDAFVG